MNFNRSLASVSRSNLILKDNFTGGDMKILLCSNTSRKFPNACCQTVCVVYGYTCFERRQLVFSKTSFSQMDSGIYEAMGERGLGFLPDMSVCHKVNFSANITALNLAAMSVYPYTVPAAVISVLYGKMYGLASKKLSFMITKCTDWENAFLWSCLD